MLVRFARLASAVAGVPVGLVSVVSDTRQYFMAVRRAARLGYALAVVLLDIDHFKAFDDRPGHPAGDVARREIARGWRTEVREIDLVARIRGEEFGLVLPGCDAAAALETVERLRGGMPAGLTASAGIAVWATRSSAEQLVADADRALHLTNGAGRDRARVSRSRAG